MSNNINQPLSSPLAEMRKADHRGLKEQAKMERTCQTHTLGFNEFRKTLQTFAAVTQSQVLTECDRDLWFQVFAAHFADG